MSLTCSLGLTFEYIFEPYQLNPLWARILLRQETLHVPVIRLLIEVFVVFKILDVSFQFLCISLLLLGVVTKHSWLFLLIAGLLWGGFICIVVFRFFSHNVYSGYSECLLSFEHARICLLELSHEMFVLEQLLDA